MKKKVLFFIESLSGGGAEQVLVTLLRHFDYERYEVTLLTMVDCGVHREDVGFSKVDYRSVIPQYRGWTSSIWYRIKYKLLYQYLPAWIVARLIIPKGYDTYVAFCEGYCTKIIAEVSVGFSWFQLFSKRSMNHKPSTINLIAWVHIDLKDYPWTMERGIYRSLQEEKDTYRRFDKVVCVSHSVEGVMKECYGLTNTTTIYNPIDVEYISRKSQEPVDFTPSDGFNIVSVGRLVPQKGYDQLIPIIARLRNEGLNFHLYILGEGEDRESLESLNLELGTVDFVHLMGYQNNPHAYVRQMNLFVCSSRAEGYSLVIAEALLLGIPVISTNCSGPNELLGADSEYGLLCDSYEDLYEKIKALVNSPELLKELRERALKRKATLDVKSTINQIYQIL